MTYFQSIVKLKINLYDDAGALVMKEEIQQMIEQEIITALTERRKALKISAERLGEEVYPGIANSRMKVQTLTQKQGNGKSRGLRVGEFVALAKALDIDPVRLLGRVLDQHEDTNFAP